MGMVTTGGDFNSSNNSCKARGCKIKMVTSPSIVNRHGDVAPIGTNIEVDVYVQSGWGNIGVLTGFNSEYIVLNGCFRIPVDNIKGFRIL